MPNIFEFDMIIKKIMFFFSNKDFRMCYDTIVKNRNILKNFLPPDIYNLLDFKLNYLANNVANLIILESLIDNFIKSNSQQEIYINFFAMNLLDFYELTTISNAIKDKIKQILNMSAYSNIKNALLYENNFNFKVSFDNIIEKNNDSLFVSDLKDILFYIKNNNQV